MSWIFYFLILYHLWKLFWSVYHCSTQHKPFLMEYISYIFDLDSSSGLRVKLVLIFNKVSFDRSINAVHRSGRGRLYILFPYHLWYYIYIFSHSQLLCFSQLSVAIPLLFPIVTTILNDFMQTMLSSAGCRTECQKNSCNFFSIFLSQAMLFGIAKTTVVKA